MIERKNKIKDSKQLVITKSIVLVIFILYAITLIFPFIWMIYNSFKTNPEFFSDIWALPEDLTNGFVNLKYALSLEINNSTILTMTLRSIFLTIVGTLVGLASTSCVSYVVAKYKFPGKNLIYAVAISIMLIPTIGSTSATYKLINDLGLYDNYLALILMYSGGFGFQFLLMHGVFKSISWQYAEAAMMDGASDFKVFTKVMLPMSMGTMVPLGILNAINIWNDYFTPYLYLKGKPTLAVGLQSMVSQMEYNANWPALFTLMIISMIPIIIVFVSFQNKLWLMLLQEV